MNNSPCQAVTFTADGCKRLGEVMSAIDDRLMVRDLLPAAEAKSEWHADPPAHTAQKEVFRLASTRLINRSDVHKSLRLVDLLSFRPKKSNILVRQSYDPESQRYSPDDPPFRCVCGKIVNPDENYSLCLQCPTAFHNECLQEGECAKCSSKVRVLRDDVLVIDSVVADQQPQQTERQIKARRVTSSPQPTLQSMRAAVVSFLEGALSIAICEAAAHDFSLDVAQSLSAAIEQELFDASDRLDNSSFYTRQARALKFNLTAKDNPELRGAVLSGLIEPKELVRMTSQQMANSKTKAMRQKHAGSEFIEKRRKMAGNDEAEGDSDDPFDPDNH